jgi:hypothetical protein
MKFRPHTRQSARYFTVMMLSSSREFGRKMVAHPRPGQTPINCFSERPRQSEEDVAVERNTTRMVDGALHKPLAYPGRILIHEKANGVL